jgi:hypothetical protein
MSEPQDGCVSPAAGPIGEAAAPDAPQSPAPAMGGTRTMTARVGQKAPDFEASAFVDGGFKNVKLSDYDGQWRVLCFYPGDFTFV